MEDTEESKKNFFKHVFNFEDESKAEMLNIVQYTLIAIIPMVLLNKSIQKYVPEADDQKSSLEVLAEIIILSNPKSSKSNIPACSENL